MAPICIFCLAWQSGGLHSSHMVSHRQLPFCSNSDSAAAPSGANTALPKHQNTYFAPSPIPARASSTTPPQKQIPSTHSHGAKSVKNGCSDNLLNPSHDINGDGWTDYIVMGFPGKETLWYENPQGKEGLCSHPAITTAQATPLNHAFRSMVSPFRPLHFLQSRLLPAIKYQG